MSDLRIIYTYAHYRALPTGSVIAMLDSGLSFQKVDPNAWQGKGSVPFRTSELAGRAAAVLLEGTDSLPAAPHKIHSEITKVAQLEALPKGSIVAGNDYFPALKLSNGSWSTPDRIETAADLLFQSPANPRVLRIGPSIEAPASSPSIEAPSSSNS